MVISSKSCGLLVTHAANWLHGELVICTYIHTPWSIAKYRNIQTHIDTQKTAKQPVTRRPASADRTARAANFRRDLEAT